MTIICCLLPSVLRLLNIEVAALSSARSLIQNKHAHEATDEHRKQIKRFMHTIPLETSLTAWSNMTYKRGPGAVTGAYSSVLVPSPHYVVLGGGLRSGCSQLRRGGRGHRSKLRQALLG